MGSGSKRAFTLIELLVVIAFIVVLVALLFPTPPHGKERARRTVCMSNLKEIDIGIHLYLNDQRNSSTGNTNAAPSPFVNRTNYRKLIGPSVGIKGTPSAQDTVGPNQLKRPHLAVRGSHPLEKILCLIFHRPCMYQMNDGR